MREFPCFRRAGLAVSLMLSACTSHVTPPLDPKPPPPVMLVGPPAPKAPPVTGLGTNLKPLDLLQLDADEFFPPGAKRIGPRGTLKVPLLPTPRARFPSTDISDAPDRFASLYSRSVQYRAIVVHWLAVLPTGGMPFELFHTTAAFDTLWSADEHRIAITHYVGENRSEVLILDADGFRLTRPLDLRPAVEQVFSALELDAPRFMKAYRWAKGSLLVVRAIGRVAVEPYEEFGYEVAVDLSTLDRPTFTYLQGYVKDSTVADRKRILTD